MKCSTRLVYGSGMLLPLPSSTPRHLALPRPRHITALSTAASHVRAKRVPVLMRGYPACQSSAAWAGWRTTADGTGHRPWLADEVKTPVRWVHGTQKHKTSIVRGWVVVADEASNSNLWKQMRMTWEAFWGVGSNSSNQKKHW